MSTEAIDLSERIAGVMHLLQKFPEEMQDDIIRASDSRAFHVFLTDKGPDPASKKENDDLATQVLLYLRDQIRDIPAARIIVGFSKPSRGAGSGGSQESPDVGMTRKIRGSVSEFLNVSIQLNDSTWLNFSGEIRRFDTIWPGIAGLYILSIVIGALVVGLWLVNRVTEPLRGFGRAAERLGKDIQADPLPENGPSEVAQAARAFNEMQERLARLIKNRTEMLAAISHDLRTPVTHLKLRAELMQDPEERDRMVGMLDDIEAMISSTLSFSHAMSPQEAMQNVDLAALIGSICDDMTDAGASAAFKAGPDLIYECRPISIKRATTNIIDNAVKYGKAAQVELTETEGGIRIAVEDDGPGVPEDRIEKIFTPFYRAEESRNADAGGTGLGLSIAQAIIHAHGGTITAENREHGGLRVCIVLPPRREVGYQAV
ncbi:MAG: ATP-binding protein [Rhodospirillales bacterium]